MFAWFRRKCYFLLPRVFKELGPVYDHPKRCALNVSGPFYTTGECLACEAPEFEAPNLLAPLTNGNNTTYFVRQPEDSQRIGASLQGNSVLLHHGPSVWGYKPNYYPASWE